MSVRCSATTTSSTTICTVVGYNPGRRIVRAAATLVSAVVGTSTCSVVKPLRHSEGRAQRHGEAVDDAARLAVDERGELAAVIDRAVHDDTQVGVGGRRGRCRRRRRRASGGTPGRRRRREYVGNRPVDTEAGLPRLARLDGEPLVEQRQGDRAVVRRGGRGRLRPARRSPARTRPARERRATLGPLIGRVEVELHDEELVGQAPEAERLVEGQRRCVGDGGVDDALASAVDDASTPASRGRGRGHARPAAGPGRRRGVAGSPAPTRRP